MEEKKKRPYNRKPQEKKEITAENYMEFSAKDLFKEIEYLRGQSNINELKQENKKLKSKLTKIGNLAKP